MRELRQRSSRADRDQCRHRPARGRAGRVPHADRRPTRGGGVRRRVRQRQPRHRPAAGGHGRRRRRGHEPRHRGRPPRLRRNRLADQRSAAQAVPGATAVGHRRREGRPARGVDRRGRMSGDDNAVRTTGLATRRIAALPRGPDRRLRVGTHTRRRRAVRRAQRAHRRQGARGRRRGDNPVELPDRGHPQQARTRAGGGQYALS